MWVRVVRSSCWGGGGNSHGHDGGIILDLLSVTLFLYCIFIIPLDDLMLRGYASVNCSCGQK